MQDTKEIEQKLVATTLYTQSLSPEAENIDFSKKIRLFTSSMSLPPIHSYLLPPSVSPVIVSCLLGSK